MIARPNTPTPRSPRPAQATVARRQPSADLPAPWLVQRRRGEELDKYVEMVRAGEGRDLASRLIAMRTGSPPAAVTVQASGERAVSPSTQRRRSELASLASRQCESSTGFESELQNVRPSTVTHGPEPSYLGGTVEVDVENMKIKRQDYTSHPNPAGTEPELKRMPSEDSEAPEVRRRQGLDLARLVDLKRRAERRHLARRGSPNATEPSRNTGSLEDEISGISSLIIGSPRCESEMERTSSEGLQLDDVPSWTVQPLSRETERDPESRGVHESSSQGIPFQTIDGPEKSPSPLPTAVEEADSRSKSKGTGNETKAPKRPQGFKPEQPKTSPPLSPRRPIRTGKAPWRAEELLHRRRKRGGQSAPDRITRTGGAGGGGADRRRDRGRGGDSKKPITDGPEMSPSEDEGEEYGGGVRLSEGEGEGLGTRPRPLQNLKRGMPAMTPRERRIELGL